MNTAGRAGARWSGRASGMTTVGRAGVSDVDVPIVGRSFGLGVSGVIMPSASAAVTGRRAP